MLTPLQSRSPSKQPCCIQQRLSSLSSFLRSSWVCQQFLSLSQLTAGRISRGCSSTYCRSPSGILCFPRTRFGSLTTSVGATQERPRARPRRRRVSSMKASLTAARSRCEDGTTLKRVRHTIFPWRCLSLTLGANRTETQDTRRRMVTNDDIGRSMAAAATGIRAVL